ncbi:hypothetical protein E4K64_34470 [Bradyrhizobium frederickii]|uniref:Uncharacterized protein n=1 Tax=Bradyrhizobium frederickii TaxID=2560054 RepID=A0A4Y9NMS1_9BRAD|nr:hypothetical protein [Bradyrhizobium frederickii]TFV69054.1 hypothetical protein E4K64_34470 [Bradyrhizobium frederickii]
MNSPIVPSFFRLEHEGSGLHEKPLIPPCSVADETQRTRDIDVPKNSRKKHPQETPVWLLRWNNADGAGI